MSGKLEVIREALRGNPSITVLGPKPGSQELRERVRQALETGKGLDLLVRFFVAPNVEMGSAEDLQGLMGSLVLLAPTHKRDILARQGGLQPGSLIFEDVIGDDTIVRKASIRDTSVRSMLSLSESTPASRIEGILLRIQVSVFPNVWTASAAYQGQWERGLSEMLVPSHLLRAS
ncbi:MAG TPA: hypothetical protein VF829_00950 [Candidatus Paceibacterota bacterium]